MIRRRKASIIKTADTRHNERCSHPVSFRPLPVHNVHFRVQVVIQVAQLLFHAGDKNFNLRSFPAHHAREERVAVRAQRLEHVDLVIATEVFHLGVLRPGALGELRPSV